MNLSKHPHLWAQNTEQLKWDLEIIFEALGDDFILYCERWVVSYQNKNRTIYTNGLITWHLKEKSFTELECWLSMIQWWHTINYKEIITLINSWETLLIKKRDDSFIVYKVLKKWVQNLCEHISQKVISNLPSKHVA